MNYSTILWLVFLSFTFFLSSDHYGAFSWVILQCILLPFLYLKDQTFLYIKCGNRFFKVYIRCSDIRKSWKELKTFCAILRLKRPLYFNENELKISALTISRQKSFLRFKTTFNIFCATKDRENVPCQKPRFNE